MPSTLDVALGSRDSGRCCSSPVAALSVAWEALPGSSSGAQSWKEAGTTSGVVVRLDDLEGVVGVRLDTAMRAYIEARRGDLARLSLRQYRYVLPAAARAIGPKLLVRNLNRKHIEEWLAGLEVAPSTARKQLSVMRGFCQWCVLHGHVKRDPTLGVRAPRQPEAMPRELGDEQVGALLAVLPDLRGELIVLLGVSGGLRAAEIAGARREDIDLDGRLMLVHGKNDKERWIHIGPQLHETLLRYLATEPGQTGWLLRSKMHAGRGISPTYVSMLVSQWMRDAGVKRHARDGRSAHALRHTMAGVMLDEGADLRVIQAALGHSTLGPTMGYLRRRIAAAHLDGKMGQRRYGHPPHPLEEVA